MNLKNKVGFNPRVPLPKKTEQVHKDEKKYDRKREKRKRYGHTDCTH